MGKNFLIAVLVLFGINAPISSTAQDVKPQGLCLEGVTYPYPVQYVTLHIQQQTLRIAYMDVHPVRPNGNTVVLLHGKNFFGLYWGPAAHWLAAKGYRVIIPDQIGFGKSAKPSHLQYTIQQLAQNTRDLLDSAGVDKIIILAHSMGGMIGMRFTLMYPDRVERLILEDPIGLEDWKLKVPYQSVDAWYKGELKQSYASLKAYEMDGYFHGQWSTKYNEMLNILAGWTLSPEYERLAWNNALTSDMIFTQPVCYEFDKIKPPTLLIVGELDRTAIGKNLVPDSVKQTMGNYPVLAKQAQGRIPHCKLVILPGIGHVPHMENFDAFTAPVAAFLDTQ
jgi:pimeloyl-ACP methyl ester carboxylesterase